MDLYWYDTGFDIFSIMFFIIFALITVTIMINIIKDITEWSNNNKQPILDINCKVVSKRRPQDSSPGRMYSGAQSPAVKLY